jgi:hypothetical protein
MTQRKEGKTTKQKWNINKDQSNELRWTLAVVLADVSTVLSYQLLSL